MRIRLGSKFRFLDEREVSCPFLEDVVFTIARITTPGYEKAMADWRARAEDSIRPVGDAYVEAKARAQMLATGRGLRGEPFKKFVDEKTEELFKDRKIELASRLEGYDNVEAISEHLIKRIDGLVDDDTGKPIEYTPAIGKELLEIPAPILEDYEDGDFYVGPGSTLGPAIRQWVIHEAGKVEAFRDEYREAASGN